MKTLKLRNVWAGLLTLTVMGGGAMRAVEAQVHASEFPAPQSAPPPPSKTVPPNDKAGAPVGSAGGGTVGAARAIPLDSMPVRTNASGGESRDVAHGTLATGEMVNLHQSTQVVGQTPPALHVIQHSEFICVREGELEFDHEVDGKVVAERVGPGGVFYVALGTRHLIKNVGTVPAKYFVVAIGGDAK
ncbi:MAG TPA: cupin domain-containing protein [Acidobacteriaceae bacterium]|jgi:mannose-6-phosphate isomerase-like protein (cupin superfamily)